MILITGTSGFIGKHLLSALVKLYGKEPLIALTSRPTEECAYLLHEDYSFDLDFFVKAGYSDIHTIIHVGAFTPKKSEDADDWILCSKNIFNTYKLLSSHMPKLSKIIYLSTLDVYGKSNVITEQTTLDPISLYGTSKLYCEKLVTSWAIANHKTYQILRIGHTYGPGEESYQKLIPNTIRNLINLQPIHIWGSGNEIRSFIYIYDVVKAIMNSLKLEDSIGPVNIVGSQQIKVIELVEKLIKISGYTPVIKYLKMDVKGRDLVFDNIKMKSFLLNEEVLFDEGLLKEWNYMKGISK